MVESRMATAYFIGEDWRSTTRMRDDGAGVGFVSYFHFEKEMR
jgi:hypothetical protein